jgi:hypothetical protein
MEFARFRESREYTDMMLCNRIDYYINKDFFTAIKMALEATLSGGMHSPPPLITAIVPNWKNPRFLEETVRSIASQDFLDEGEIEVILIDDGSPWYNRWQLNRAIQRMGHAGSDAISKFSKFEFKKVGHGGKNRVLEEAKPYISARSGYVCVMDSDDVFAPAFLKVQFDALEAARKRDDNVVMSYSDSILIDEKGNCVGLGTAPDFDREMYFFGGEELDGVNYIPGNALVVAKVFKSAVPNNFANDRDKLWRHQAELGYDGVAIHIWRQEANSLRQARNYFYRQVRDSLSNHSAVLDEEGFLQRWPEGVPNHHWKRWLELPREEQIALINKMPNVCTTRWNSYEPAVPARTS